MDREFNPTSTPIRTVIAVAAVLCTALVFGSIERLADHYNSKAQLARAQPVIVAQR